MPVRNSWPLFIGVLSPDSDFVTLNFYVSGKNLKKPRISRLFVFGIMHTLLLFDHSLELQEKV